MAIGVVQNPLRLANAVRALRHERAWSVDRLAEVAGVHRLVILNLESERDHKPRSDTMLKLAAAFGVPLCRVFWSVDDESAA